MSGTTVTSVAPVRGSYFSAFVVSFQQSLLLMLRRKRIALASGVTLVPVLIPLAIVFFSISHFAEDGNRIFVFLIEQIYLKAMAPLLALFYGCMLLGEEVEMQTITYLITRPLPRSALVLGKFAAYVVVTGMILLSSIVLVYGACSAVGGFAIDGATLTLLVHYLGIHLLALAGYGALTLFLGACSKRPVVIGVVFLFGWQRLVLFFPGAADFLTIEKYLNAILPKLATERQNIVIKLALAEFQKQQLTVQAPTALISLAVIVAVLIFMTCMVVRYREFSQSRALAQ